jgi:hypothetical protein
MSRSRTPSRISATSVLVVLLLLASLTAAGAPADKRAIFWRGDLLVFNESAAADVVRRGFTHTVIKSPNESKWLCRFRGGALQPLLDLSLHNKVLKSLRSFSPYSQPAALRAANASLHETLLAAPGCLAGVVDDIEEKPFPVTMYLQTGGIDRYHSSQFPDTVQMVGGNGKAINSSLAELWPQFSDWPRRGSHSVPNLTLENIEYNFPLAVTFSDAAPVALSTAAEPSPGAEPSPVALATGSGSTMVAQLFTVATPTRVTRADITIWRPKPSATNYHGLGGGLGGDPKWTKTYGDVKYFVTEVSAAGQPDLTKPVLCQMGCAIAPDETNTASLQPLPLYLDPTEAELEAHHQYAFILQWRPPKDHESGSGRRIEATEGTEGSGADGSGYLLGCDLGRSQPPLLVGSAAHNDSAVWRPAPGPANQRLRLTLYVPNPPVPFTAGQMHAEWVQFRAAVMAGFVRTYASAAAAASVASHSTQAKEVYIYSGYLGNPGGYPRTSHNPSGRLAESYSVDWSRLASAGLDVAVCGYSTISPAETMRALAQGNARAVVVGGSDSTQAVFAERYGVCNGGAMALSSALDTPGFFVPQ